MCQEDSDRHGEGFALVTLAEAYHGLLRHEQALARYQQAQDLNKQIGARIWQGHAMLSIGDTHRDMGHLEEARASWQQSLAMLEELGSAKAKVARARPSHLDDHHDQDPTVL